MIHLRIAFRGFVFVDLTLLADEDATPEAEGPDVEIVEAVSSHEAAELDEDDAEARCRPLGFRIP